MPRHCYVLRVFTRGVEGGNHLGVVTDSSGLSDPVMQQIATHLGFSETIYLDWRDQELPRVRIFTPRAELPFAGHPLVGMNWLINELGPGGTDAIECGIGRVGARMDGDTSWIDVPLDQPVDLQAELGSYDPGSRPRSVRLAEMPLRYLIVEVADSDAVRAAPVPAAGMVTVYARLDDHSVHTRFFAPGHGVVEDPATGSAAVALAASLQAAGEPDGQVTIRQGEEIGFPSEIWLRWSDGLSSIGGAVVKDEVRWLEE